MTPVKYRLPDGVEISLRVPTLHPDDKELSKALNRVGNYDLVLRDLIKRAQSADNQDARDKAVEALTEAQDSQNEALRKFLKLALNTDLGLKDIDGKVIAQCTEEDQRNILQLCREGSDYAQRMLTWLPITASDVRAWAKYVFPLPADLTEFANSLTTGTAPGNESGQPSGTGQPGS